MEKQKRELGPMDYLIAAVFGTTIVVVLAQVIWRYVFNNSLTWTEELSRYLFTWIIFLGAAVAIRDNSHIKVEFLVSRLPKRIRPALEVINTALIMLFLAFIAVAGFLWVKLNSGTRSPALELPVNWVFYAALPVAALLGLGYAIARILGPLIRHKRKAGDE